MSDAYLHAAVRTPFGRFNGALSGVRPDDLAATALTGLLDKAPGLSEPAVRKRLERLRSTGVLHFAVEHDSEPLGQGVEALVWLTTAPQALAGTGRFVAAPPEVRFAAAVTGRSNLVLSVLRRTAGDLYAFLSEKTGRPTGVNAVETAVTLRRVKTPTPEPR